MKLFHNNIIVIVCIAAIYMVGCKGNNSATVAPEQSTTKDSFFPVTSYISGQIALFDSLDVTPLHVRTVKDKIDSFWLKRETLAALLSSFLRPEINVDNLTAYFKEARFKDQTLNSITFTYDPKVKLPDSILLRHWDVYVNPDDGKVTKIYIVKAAKDGAQVYQQQYIWNSNKSAQITILKTDEKGNTEVIQKDQFIWNFTDPE
jgi:hypothetical protein